MDKSLFFKKIRSDLTERYGKDKAAAIWKDASLEFQALADAEPDTDKNSKTYVFPAVAIYRAVYKHDPDNALEVVRAYGTKTGLWLKGILEIITALPGVPTFMWKNMDKIAQKMSDGYECRDVNVTEHLCIMDIVSCPLYDKAKELGTPEAVQMICCMDKEYMTGFRGIDYKRTKSVAEGDDCCDYRLKDSRK